MKTMEITTKSKILTDEGKLKVKGYSTKNIFEYNKEQISANKFRVKEWDFYQITSDAFCMQMTIGHVGYMANLSATLFEFSSKRKISVGRMIPLKSLSMERNCTEDQKLSFSSKGLRMCFDVDGNTRRLTMNCDDKKIGKCEVDVVLKCEGENGIIVLTPFEKENQFYYNHKLNCMSASGYACFGENHFEFTCDKAFGLLDFGRGVLPFSHSWIWGSASGLLDGNSFGFNVGKFGDTSNASENIVYYKGKSFKFGEISIEFDEENYMKDLKIFSECGKFNLTLTPKFDNFTTTKLLFVNNSCHQVFGTFNGTILLDDEKIILNDFLGFIEHAHNNW